MIALAVFLQNYRKKRILYFVPLAVATVHFLFFRFKGNIYHTRYYYGLFYIGAVVMALPVLTSLPVLAGRFTRIKKMFISLVTTFCILADVHTIVLPMVWNSAMRNHTKQGYVDSFISATHDMEKYYSLKDWKKIDIPALREQFLPAIQRAEETQDEGLFAAAMFAYAFHFYDGHVNVWIPEEEPWLRCLNLLAGNDYGFSMLRVEGGKTIAVYVEEGSEAWENGIRNQTEITGWNGQQIDEAIEETEFIYLSSTMPVKATEDLFKPIMLATKGMWENGEKGIVADLIGNASITDDSQRPPALVRFIDEDGKEKEVKLASLGGGINRFEWAYILLDWVEYSAFPDLKNLETAMINEDTAYMVRNCEQSDTFFDVLSYFTNRNPKVRRQLIEELTARKAEGMKKLIIDARSNSGGFWAIGVETASLFSNRTYDISKRSSELFGKTKMIQTVTVPADGRFSDIEVLVLVDHYCVSAGDSFVKMLQQCPNVTVMGLTPSNCSCQEVGGRSYLSNSICNIVYPVNWLYEVDETTRYIDTDEKRECTVPLDVQIPLTYELAQSLSDNYKTRDIILEKAVEYLK